MSESVIPPLADFQLREYLPFVLEKTMEELSLPPYYEVIHQISEDFAQQYQTLTPLLTDPYIASTIASQINQGKIDSPLKKFFETLRANYAFNKVDYDQFRYLIAQNLLAINKVDKETIQNKIELFETLFNYHFGDIIKIIKSKEFKVNDEKMQIIYPQVLEAYERVLMKIEENKKKESLVDKINLINQIHFPLDEAELLDYYEKNQSLLESTFAVQKIENIAILTHLLSEGSDLDVGILIKEVLVLWRNEISEITRIAKEEKRILKEEAKKKKIQTTEATVDLLFNEIIPRFLQKKNLRTILLEIKDKVKDKKTLAQIMKEMNIIEKDFLIILSAKDGSSYYKRFEENQYDETPFLYFAVLYKAIIENQIDFLAELIKTPDEYYLLRVGARNLLFIKMLQNTRIKNPVGANRIISLFFSSFERFILNEIEPLDIKKRNLYKLSKMVITGLLNLSTDIDTQLTDLFIKVYSDILDVNLVNKFASLKKISEKESESLELLKDAFKLYEVIIKELNNTQNKKREQILRNNLLLTKMERKLSGSAKKIKSRSVVLS